MDFGTNASSSAACPISMLCQRETEMWYNVDLNTSVTPSDSTGKEDWVHFHLGDSDRDVTMKPENVRNDNH